MKTNFLQLMMEQHQARVALEAAIDRLFQAEAMLIAENPRLPETTRQRGQTAALELVELVMERKLKSLANAPHPIAPSADEIEPT